jgi:hypothetical protein
LEKHGLKHINTIKELVSIWERDTNFILKNSPYKQGEQKKEYNQYANSTRASFLCWLKEYTCEMCNFKNETRSFNFHHVDSSKKKMNVLGSVGRKNKVKIIKEVLKCVYVCENCHYKIHAQEGGLDGQYEIINRRRYSYISNLLGGTKRSRVG